MTALPSLSIIIVTYNSAPFLRATLESVFAQDYPGCEVILLDNASSDDSLAIAREFEPRGLRIIHNTVNRGFAGGNNDGVRASRGELIFLVNPDIEMNAGCLREVARAFAVRPDLGILGAKLIAPDGQTILHCGGKVGFPAHCSLYGRGERDDDGNWNEPFEVEFVVGAALALRRSLWERLGGLDEDLNPAYFEDTDLCLRTRRLGFKVLCWPAIRLIHHENVSCEYRSMTFWRLHHRNRLWFTLKNYPLSAILFKALPAEMSWYFSGDSVGLRKLMLRLYASSLKKYVKRKVLRIRG